MPIRKLLPCILCLSLAACDGTGFEPQPSGVSTLVFHHSGVGTHPASSYAAIGEVSLESGGGVPPGEWAFGMRSGPPPRPLLVEASRPTADGRYDRVTMYLPRGVQAGQTLQFGLMCETSPTCANLDIQFGVHPDLDAPENVCSVAGGELRLTILTDRRAAGTFSGIASCFALGGAQAQVTGGSFNVALVAPPAG